VNHHIPGCDFTLHPSSRSVAPCVFLSLSAWIGAIPIYAFLLAFKVCGMLCQRLQIKLYFNWGGRIHGAQYCRRHAYYLSLFSPGSAPERFTPTQAVSRASPSRRLARDPNKRSSVAVVSLHNTYPHTLYTYLRPYIHASTCFPFIPRSFS
jgi:hypothetical protein